MLERGDPPQGERKQEERQQGLEQKGVEVVERALVHWRVGGWVGGVGGG